MGSCAGKRFISLITLLAFILMSVVPSFSQSALSDLILPDPGKMVPASAAFVPVLLKGMKIDPQKPFKFEFIIETGNAVSNDQRLRQESEKLIRYFLAALTIPEKDLWVNLSPYENDRIITDEFSLTEMGRDLLGQDYILKQITASLIYPENETGKAFWKKVYAKAFEIYGTTDIPVDTFNKVWIAADKAVVYENGARAYIVASKLKVMLESDYVAEANNVVGRSAHEDRESKGVDRELAKDIIRTIVLPELAKEVNEGQNFARLRQIYHALILAKWFRESLKESILSRKYANQKKIKGVDLAERTDKAAIYNKYVEAFRKGVFNFIKEEYDDNAQETIERKYFSGGFDFAQGMVLERSDDPVLVSGSRVTGNLVDVTGDFSRVPVNGRPLSAALNYFKDRARRFGLAVPVALSLSISLFAALPAYAELSGPRVPAAAVVRSGEDQAAPLDAVTFTEINGRLKNLLRFQGGKILLSQADFVKVYGNMSDVSFHNLVKVDILNPIYYNTPGSQEMENFYLFGQDFFGPVVLELVKVAQDGLVDGEIDVGRLMGLAKARIDARAATFEAHVESLRNNNPWVKSLNSEFPVKFIDKHNLLGQSASPDKDLKKIEDAFKKLPADHLKYLKYVFIGEENTFARPDSGDMTIGINLNRQMLDMFRQMGVLDEDMTGMFFAHELGHIVESKVLSDQAREEWNKLAQEVLQDVALDGKWAGELFAVVYAGYVLNGNVPDIFFHAHLLSEYGRTQVDIHRFHDRLQAFFENNVPTQDNAEAVKADKISTKDLGGIDLNAERMSLERQGRGVNWEWPSDPVALESMEIQGLVPVIMNILPVNDLPRLMGIAQTGLD